MGRTLPRSVHQVRAPVRRRLLPSRAKTVTRMVSAISACKVTRTASQAKTSRVVSSWPSVNVNPLRGNELFCSIDVPHKLNEERTIADGDEDY